MPVMGDFKKGLIPLIAPITLVRRYVTKYRVACLADPYYLRPHPLDLKLRNHA
jgi:uncharacterized protein YbgA (DUF1722 family)